MATHAPAYAAIQAPAYAAVAAELHSDPGANDMKSQTASKGCASAEPLKEESSYSEAPTDGSLQDSQAWLLKNFEEVYACIDYVNYLTWLNRREAIKGLWELHMLQRCGWRGSTLNGSPLPHNVLKCIAVFLDPKLHTAPQETAAEDSPLVTARSLFLKTLETSECPRVGALKAQPGA
mmetsp:Transcript_108469/g.329730  ORF Transcript_108469/g.329730 Transcript_108469/m.329730 type:complete len:178 (-) Transcript_108469:30-563(-)